MRMKKCEGASWCTAVVPEGTFACPVHTKFPAINSWEKPDAWGIRLRRSRAAKVAAAKRQAKLDAERAAAGKR